jgi:hypothetical protein
MELTHQISYVGVQHWKNLNLYILKCYSQIQKQAYGSQMTEVVIYFVENDVTVHFLAYI